MTAKACCFDSIIETGNSLVLLDYLATAPQRLRRRLIVARQNAGAYWRQRLDTIRKHVGWLVLRGCVSAREHEGLFTVRYHGEYVRVMEQEGIVVVTRGADASVPVRRLRTSQAGVTERISGVFLHPKKASLLVVFTQEGRDFLSQEGLFIELDELESLSLRPDQEGESEESGVAPSEVADAPPAGGNVITGSNEGSSVEADDDPRRPTPEEEAESFDTIVLDDEDTDIDTESQVLAQDTAPPKSSEVPLQGLDGQQGSAPESGELGGASRGARPKGVWFMGKDLGQTDDTCIGFSPDGAIGLSLLRRFDREGVKWKSFQRLSRDLAVPAVTLATAKDTEYLWLAQEVLAVERALKLDHLAPCIEGTRRSDVLWFVAFRGRPVLVDASGGELVVTAQSSQPRAVAPLMPGEKITAVYQHPDRPVAMVLLGIGENSPLPQRALLVGTGYTR